jgi:hypothetical protein
MATQKTTDIRRDYLGRMFMPPTAAESGDRQQELWVNFGWLTDNNRRFPEYVDMLQPICSRQQFEELMRTVASLADAYNFKEAARVSAVMLCFMMCIPCPLLSVLGKKRDFEAKLTEMLTAISGTTFPTHVRFVFSGMPERIADDQVCLDQFGKPLLLTYDNDPGIVTESTWPPYGYNLVIQVPRSYDLRAHWLRRAAAAVSAAPVLSAADRMKELDKIRAASLITESEYQTMHDAILFQVTQSPR